MTGVVRLDSPNELQREAAVRLVGRPRRSGTSLRIDLAAVDEVLRRGPWPPGLADAVVALTGPVVDQRALAEREAEAWRAVEQDLLDDGPSRLAEWWSGFCAGGGLKRAAGAEARRTDRAPGPDVGAQLVTQLRAVMDELPVQGEPLAVLARRVLGDAHALDDSRALGRLAVGAVAASFAGGSSRARSTREVWAAAGVVMSNVASTVLALGLSGAAHSEGTSLAAATSACAEQMRAARAPLVLTLDQVRSGGIASLRSDRVVHVCENPTVVELAATRWAAVAGNETAPTVRQDPVLVCTWGQPSTAVVELLALLTAHGAECRYHGDFDWPGLRVAAFLRTRVPWTPWRFVSSDYRAAANLDVPSIDLSGVPASSLWDPALAVAMSEYGRAIEEEAVIDLLVDDLLA